MWAVNDGYLHKIITSIINSIKIPLKIDYKVLGGVNPQHLDIHKKLQIGGNYFESIFQMSELTSIVEPSKMLSQLELIKRSVCKDIDSFYSFENKDEIFEVDSDNIMAIVTFLLCRVGEKIE